jgi:hypothetical protein
MKLQRRGEESRVEEERKGDLSMLQCVLHNE